MNISGGPAILACGSQPNLCPELYGCLMNPRMILSKISYFISSKDGIPNTLFSLWTIKISQIKFYLARSVSKSRTGKRGHTSLFQTGAIKPNTHYASKSHLAHKHCPSFIGEQRPIDTKKSLQSKTDPPLSLMLGAPHGRITSWKKPTQLHHTSLSQRAGSFRFHVYK